MSIKYIDLSCFECKKHSMTPQGSIDYLYVRAFRKNGCAYHIAKFYYQFEIYDGKTSK